MSRQYNIWYPIPKLKIAIRRPIEKITWLSDISYTGGIIPATDDELDSQFENSGKFSVLLHYTVSP